MRKSPAIMISKKRKQRWRMIKRYVERKQGRVGVNELARCFKLAPSNVSRGLKQRKIGLEPTRFPWETVKNSKRGLQAKKALALYFLGLNPAQIERLLPIKAETVRNYILALTLT